MGDMNGGPGSGGYGGGPQWNTYGRGPQQSRQQMEPPTPWFGGFGNGGGTNWGRPQEGWGSWGGGNPWNGGWGDQFMNQMQRPLANWQQGNPPPAQGGFQNAPGLYQQYQGMQPGAERDALIRQMQGSDNGAAYRAAMRNSGYQLNTSPDGTFSYSPQSGRDYGMQAVGNIASQQNAGPPPPRSADSVAGQGGQPPQTGTYSSQGPQSGFDPLRDQAWTPNQQLMMQSGRGQRGFWQGPTSPWGMQGPWGYPDQGYRRSPNNPYGGMQNGAPK